MSIARPLVSFTRAAGEKTRHAALTIDSVSKSFGPTLVVDNVSLDVSTGEFVTLLGPSGSGKTTMLNMIAGFVTPSSGDVRLDGKSILRLPPHRRDIGMVFQHYALFPHMTAADNVGFPLEMRRVKKQEVRRRVSEALELVNLLDFRDRYPRQLSGGQRQRVALARAIVFQPRLLLMDEPLSSLDKRLRERLQNEIKRIHREVGVTVVYVTHDQEEAFSMSDRVALFNRGRIEQAGTAEDLYERPATVFVADFVGESNLFRGSAIRDGDIVMVTTGGLRLRVCAQQQADVGTQAAARCAVMVRPERVEVRGTEEALPEGGYNVCAGIVQEVAYVGTARIYDIAVNSTDMRVTARVGALQAASSHPFVQGDTVQVLWRVEHGRLLTDDTPESQLDVMDVPGGTES